MKPQTATVNPKVIVFRFKRKAAIVAAERIRQIAEDDLEP